MSHSHHGRRTPQPWASSGYKASSSELVALQKEIRKLDQLVRTSSLNRTGSATWSSKDSMTASQAAAASMQWHRPHTGGYERPIHASSMHHLFGGPAPGTASSLELTGSQLQHTASSSDLDIPPVRRPQQLSRGEMRSAGHPLRTASSFSRSASTIPTNTVA